KNLGGMKGTYKDQNGKEYTIKFDVTIKYDKNAATRKLAAGENIMEFHKEVFKDERSNVARGETETKQTGDAGWYDKDGNKIDQKDAHRSNGDYFFDGIERYEKTNTKADMSGGAWGSSFPSAMHELMHLFGLNDRYSGNGTPDPSFGHDIMN